MPVFGKDILSRHFQNTNCSSDLVLGMQNISHWVYEPIFMLCYNKWLPVLVVDLTFCRNYFYQPLPVGNPGKHYSVFLPILKTHRGLPCLSLANALKNYLISSLI